MLGKLRNFSKSKLAIILVAIIIVPIHFPKIKPPIRAIGVPNPRNGNTHKIVITKKIMNIKNKLEFLTSRKYNLFSLIKS